MLRLVLVLAGAGLQRLALAAAVLEIQKWGGRTGRPFRRQTPRKVVDVTSTAAA